MKTQTTEKQTPTPTLDQMPPVPAGLSFRLKEVKTISLPHPYCITPRHVAEASDHFGGMLGADAIRAAEKKGAQCDICKNNWRNGGDQVLPFDKHENMTTLVIVVPAGTRDINKIKGLHPYLYDNKATFESLGIQGFAFPSS